EVGWRGFWGSSLVFYNVFRKSFRAGQRLPLGPPCVESTICRQPNWQTASRDPYKSRKRHGEPGLRRKESRLCHKLQKTKWRPVPPARLGADCGRDGLLAADRLGNSQRPLGRKEFSPFPLGSSYAAFSWG